MIKYFLPFLTVLILHSCQKKMEVGAPPERVFPVDVADVTQRDVPIYIQTIGHVIAFNQVLLRPQVGGKVTDVYVNGGDHVQAHQVLYQIDPFPYQMAVERAEAILIKDQAELEYAREKLERYSKLIQSNFVSELNIQDYTRNVKVQEGQLRMDQADLALAQRNLNHCSVRSPISGKVGLSKVDPGNIVRADDPEALVNILQVQPIYVQFSLSQKEFQEAQEAIRKGEQPFTVTLPYGNQQRIEGKLEACNNELDYQTGTIQLQGALSNEKDILWPGQFVQVHLLTHVKSKALIVPTAAVQMGQQGAYVYILNADQTVKRVPIKVGHVIEEEAIIEEGLEPNMQVVVNGQVNLREGAKVAVTHP